MHRNGKNENKNEMAKTTIKKAPPPLNFFVNTFLQK
jgi:hypothetical protein